MQILTKIQMLLVSVGVKLAALFNAMRRVVTAPFKHSKACRLRQELESYKSANQHLIDENENLLNEVLMLSRDWDRQSMKLEELETSKTKKKASRQKTGRRIDASQASKIKKLYAAGGVTQAELAERFGVSPNHVSSIITGRRWSKA